MVAAIQEPESKAFEVGEQVWYVCRVANARPEKKIYYPAEIVSVHPRSMVIKVFKGKRVDIRRLYVNQIERVIPYGTV